MDCEKKNTRETPAGRNWESLAHTQHHQTTSRGSAIGPARARGVLVDRQIWTTIEPLHASLAAPIAPSHWIEKRRAVRWVVRRRSAGWSGVEQEEEEGVGGGVPLTACASACGVVAVQASALRVRSSSLWSDGVNATAHNMARFTVPPRVVSAPFARRVDVVFERFIGNASTALFAAPRGGKVVATHAMASATACAVTGTGPYGVAVRLQPPPPPPTPLPPPPPPAAVRERWWAWTVVVGLGGVVAVSFLVVTVAAAVRWSRRRRREDMDVRALAREELGRMAVRGSRMPAAKMVRTRPELEDGSPLAWRR
ncbi:hypothetical protein D1007_50201 [Hordeum vulgare]|nr:hypothetical protein D1007_50201 [Hordeum vulgare]